MSEVSGPDERPAAAGLLATQPANDHVLIVEDDASISAMVSTVVAREGLRVQRAATGADALHSIRLFDFSAIVLDLMLPECSGFEVLDDLRRTKPGHLKRVVVMTASPRHAKDLDAAELTGVLIKPFDIDDLAKMIRSAVAHGKRAVSEAEARS
jgi:DNA-binding response OmpR family regulator